MKCLPNLFTKSFFIKKNEKKQPFHTSARRPAETLLAGVYTGPDLSSPAPAT